MTTSLNSNPARTSATGRMSLVAQTMAGAREALAAVDADTPPLSVDDQLQQLDLQIASGC